MRYAAKTTTSVERSREEISRLIIKHGASQFLSGWNHASATIVFEMRNLRLRFVVQVPKAPNPKSRVGREMTPTPLTKWIAQAERVAWRGLLLIIKAKLEAVASGAAIFEQEFLAYIVLPKSNETVGDLMLPKIAEVYKTGKLPPLLSS